MRTIAYSKHELRLDIVLGKGRGDTWYVMSFGWKPVRFIVHVKCPLSQSWQFFDGYPSVSVNERASYKRHMPINCTMCISCIIAHLPDVHESESLEFMWHRIGNTVKYCSCIRIICECSVKFEFFATRQRVVLFCNISHCENIHELMAYRRNNWIYEASFVTFHNQCLRTLTVDLA